MQATSLNRNRWFYARVVMTGLLAAMLLVGRLPAAAAQEEPAAQLSSVTAASEETVEDGNADAAADETAADKAAQEQAAADAAAAEEAAQQQAAEEAAAEEAAKQAAAEQAAAEQAAADQAAAEQAAADQAAKDKAAEEQAAREQAAEDGAQATNPEGSIEPNRSVKRLSGEMAPEGAKKLDDPDPNAVVAAAGDASASLDQWGNLGAGAWQNGNLNSSNSAYVEGDVVPFRARLGNLGVPGTTHTITIEWATTKNGTHAYDYIEDYNATESSNPCAGVVGCVHLAPTDTATINPDPQVTVPQNPGVFTIWGATIDSVSAYGESGPFLPNDTQKVTVSFTSLAADAVLAWGGHISSRIQWTPDLTAAQIAGSPYHMRLLEIDGKGGNQDRSLSANGVFIPLIEVDKSADYTAANVGTLVTYTYEITNTGELPLTGITLTDDKLGAITPLPKTSLAVGESMTVTKTYTTTAADLAATPLENIATVSGFSADGSNPTDTDDWSIDISNAPVPNVSFNKTSDAPTGPNPPKGAVDADGGTFEYELAATNAAGAGASATGVVIKDTVPAGLDIVSASWAIGAGPSTPCSPIVGQNVTCSVGTLAAGQTATATIAVEADDTVCGDVTNDGRVEGTNFTTLDDDVTVELLCAPALTIDKSVTSTGPYEVGDEVEYTVEVENTGNADATNVVISDDLDDDLDNVAVTLDVDGTDKSADCDPVGANNEVSCDIATLAPGSVATMVVTADITLDNCDGLDNTASVDSDETASQDSLPVSVDVHCLTIAKTVTSTGPYVVGDEVEYTVEVENTGSAAATNVEITDDLDNALTGVAVALDVDGTDKSADCGVAAGNLVTCDIATFAAGSVATMVVTADLAAGNCDGVDNLASVDSDQTAAQNSLTVSVDVHCLTIAKTVTSTGPYEVGDEVEYTVEVENTGSAAATNVEIADDLDDDLDNVVVTLDVDGTDKSADCAAVGANNEVSCDIASLAAGSVATMVVTADITADNCDGVDNQASVDSDQTAAQNSLAVSVDVHCLTIAKTVTSTGPYEVGDTIEYTVVASNTGSAAATDVVVSDDLDDDLDNVVVTLDVDGTDKSADCAPVGAGNTVSCDIATFAPGSVATMVVLADVTIDNCDGVDNQASVDSDQTTAQNSAAVSVDVHCLTIAKTVTSTGPYEVGDQIEYTVEVENTGSAAATNVVVSDDLDDDLDNVAVTLDVDGTDQSADCDPVGAGNTVSCDIATFAAGSVATMVVTADITADNCDGVDNMASVVSDQTVSQDSAAVNVTVVCLTIAKVESSTGPYGNGDTIEYTVTVENTGSASATDVVVSDDLDDRFSGVTVAFDVDTVDKTTDCAAVTALNEVACDIVAPFAPGSVATMVVTAVATVTSCPSVSNQASASSSNHSTIDSALVNVSIACPGPAGITVVKTAAAPDPDAGGVITYTYRITNTGSQDLHTISLDDDKLGGITLPATTLGVGMFMTATATHVITTDNVDDGTLTNKATVFGTPALIGGRVTDEDFATVAFPQNPGIEIEKSADRREAGLGDVIMYTYEVTNTGNVTLTDLSVFDDVIGSILAGSAGKSLAAGQSLTLTSPYETTEEDGVNGGVTNVATATGTPPGGTPVTDNDKVTVPVGVTVVEDSSALRVIKEVDGTNAGEAYQFSVDCGAVSVGPDSAFTIPAKGGSHEIGLRIPVGTNCKVVETDDGGATLTTVAVNGGAATEGLSAIANVRQQGTTVTFVNAFADAPQDLPRPPRELPATGSDANLQLIVAFAALLLGSGLVRLTRPRRRQGWLRA